MWKLSPNPSNTRNIDDFKAVTWLKHHKMGPAGEWLQKLNYLWSFTRKCFRRYVKKVQMLYKIPGCKRSWCKLQCAISWHKMPKRLGLGSSVLRHLERMWFAFQFHSSLKWMSQDSKYSGEKTHLAIADSCM